MAITTTIDSKEDFFALAELFNKGCFSEEALELMYNFYCSEDWHFDFKELKRAWTEYSTIINRELFRDYDYVLEPDNCNVEELLHEMNNNGVFFLRDRDCILVMN